MSVAQQCWETQRKCIASYKWPEADVKEWAGPVVFTVCSGQQMVMRLLCVWDHAFKGPEVSKLHFCFQQLFNLGRAVFFRW
jgi:hypothetical protein